MPRRGEEISNGPSAALFEHSLRCPIASPVRGQAPPGPSFPSSAGISLKPRLGANVQRTLPMSKLIRRRIILDPLEFSSANTRRTPGLHLTEVVKDMLTVAGIGKKHKSAEDGGYTQEQLRKFQLQGYLWEDVVTEGLTDKRIFWEDVHSKQLMSRIIQRAEYMRLPEVAFNPKTGHAFWVEYDKDGKLLTPIPLGYYLCSPDGGRAEILRFSLAEFKWTTKSCRMDPEKERPDWFYQAPGYLGAISAAMEQQVSRVEWHVQFPVGDRWGCPPEYEEWEKEYSESEQGDVWSAVDAHARWRVKSDPNHPWRRWL